MDQRELKRRTKAFAIKIVRIFESLPQKGAALVLAGSYYGPEPLWGLITDPLAGQNPLLILLPRWALLRKRLMKRSIGWSF